MDARTLALVTAELEDAPEDFDPRFCVGNSHAWITAQYSTTSARCACGSTITLASPELAARLHRTGEVWVHANHSPLCPPYECECGQRHNV